MNVFGNEKQPKDCVGNAYGSIVGDLRRSTEFSWVSAELPITPFMVKRCGRAGYSKCMRITVLVKGNYAEAMLGFEE